MQIDCYGFEATSQFFRRKELDAHLMKRICRRWRSRGA